MSQTRVGFRTFRIPTELSERIWRCLNSKWGLSPGDAKSARVISESVQRMSDYYVQHPMEKTPWSEPWCQQAQLAYYLPLNFVRCSAVFGEGQRLGFFDGIHSATDYGCGLGAAALAIITANEGISCQGIEESQNARDLFSKLEYTSVEVLAPGRKVRASELMIFSYVLTENIDQQASEWLKSNSLAIIEPSTKSDSRRLLNLRKKLIEGGYIVWAPCTHQLSCPLLETRDDDWCHDRIHLNQPDWFLQIEGLLPIKNKTLTMSYLLASRRSPPQSHPIARVVGDIRHEKGKARIMICRSERREFLSMLSRDGELDEISRGALIKVPDNGTLIGNELRIKKNTSWD